MKTWRIEKRRRNFWQRRDTLHLPEPRRFNIDHWSTPCGRDSLKRVTCLHANQVTYPPSPSTKNCKLPAFALHGSSFYPTFLQPSSSSLPALPSTQQFIDTKSSSPNIMATTKLLRLQSLRRGIGADCECNIYPPPCFRIQAWRFLCLSDCVSNTQYRLSSCVCWDLCRRNETLSRQDHRSE